MRLPEGIVLDEEGTFGLLKFSAMRREVRERNEDGTVSANVTGRTYDLRSKVQGMMIQVTIPAEVPVKEFEYGSEVCLVDPTVDTVAMRTYGRNAEVGWYIKADDIVLKRGAAHAVPKPKPEAGKGETGNKPEGAARKG